MQPFEMKALELEMMALTNLDGFIHEHALYFLMAVIYLMLALLVWVLCGALRRTGGKSKPRVRHGIAIYIPIGRPPAPPEFDPFPPCREPSPGDGDDHYSD